MESCPVNAGRLCFVKEVVVMAKLTDKQKKFVDEYLIDLNATQAAIRAGYSKKTAYRIGAELLQKTSVSEHIQKRQADRQHRTEITQDRVLKELAAIGFADIADFVSVQQHTVYINDTEKMPQEKRKAIAGIKEGQNGIEIKLNDKVKALELIGKHLAMFTEKVNHSGNVGVQMDVSKLSDAQIDALLKKADSE